MIRDCPSRYIQYGDPADSGALVDLISLLSSLSLTLILISANDIFCDHLIQLLGNATMSADALTVETFTEYGIGMVFLAVRLYARLDMGGIRGLRLDDVFAVAGMVRQILYSTV